jgi:hypothetical protein
LFYPRSSFCATDSASERGVRLESTGVFEFIAAEIDAIEFVVNIQFSCCICVYSFLPVCCNLLEVQMHFAKATRYPPPAVPIPQMISGYSGGMKKRILRYTLAAFVVGFIIFCEIRKQSWSSEYQSSSLRQQHLHGEPLSSGHGLVKQPLREKNDGAPQIDFSAATRPVVGKITISFGEPDPVYDRAIRSHEYHNKRMGYPQFVLKERVLSGLWSKHAYIFSVLVQELAKPEDQRLLWLMFVSST